MSDPINPDHYKDEDGKECWEAMVERYGADATAIFFHLNAFKYRFRAGKKGPKEEDLKKARKCNEIAYNIPNCDMKKPWRWVFVDNAVTFARIGAFLLFAVALILLSCIQ